MSAENINQVYMANPITTNTSTDLMYFGQSPYGVTNDAAMTYANFAAQFVKSGNAVLLTPLGSQTITVGNLQVGAGSLRSGLSTGGFAGEVALFSPTAGMGNLQLLAADNGSNISVKITNANMNQNSIFTLPNPGVTNTNFIISNALATQHIVSSSLQIDSGSVISGISTGGSPGNLILYSPTSSRGFFQYTAVDNSGNFGISMTNAPFGQSATITIPDPGVSAANMALEVDGTFTPTITCLTPGDLSVVYANQTGVYVKIGNIVTVNVRIQFTPTFTTASGELQIASLPFTVQATNGIGWCGSLSYMTGGITWPAGLTSMNIIAEAGGNFCGIWGTGSGVNSTPILITGLVTGTQYHILFTVSYKVA